MTFDRVAYMKEYNIKTRQKQYDRKKERAKTNPALWRRENLLYTYKLTLEAYDLLLKSQNGLCAICGSPPTFETNLYVDHDHACCSGKRSCGECVRGLLCFKCNSGLGNFNDNIEKLKSSIDYLERWAT